MSAHRAWDTRRPGRLGVDTILTSFPNVRTKATRRVRVVGRRRGRDRSQVARATAWQAQQQSAGAR